MFFGKLKKAQAEAEMKIQELEQKQAELENIIRAYEDKLTQTDKKVTDITEVYKDEIRSVIKKNAESEVSSTNSYGVKVRYTDQDTELFPRRRKRLNILVTATMSAGKSTLVNVLAGEKLVFSQNESATGKIYHILNKVDKSGFSRFEDKLETFEDAEALWETCESQSERDIYIAANFKYFKDFPVEIIDTPGTNYSGNKNHLELTRRALQENNYDVILCVLNATQVGTYDERKNLQLIKSTGKPVIFALNKVDTFDKKRDSIEESLATARKDLADFGFDDPKVLPVSAYLALLGQLESSGKLDKFAMLELELLIRKFSENPLYQVDREDKESKEEKVFRLSGMRNLKKELLSYAINMEE